MVEKTINVKFKKLHPDAVIPSYAHDGDVCMDLTAISVEYDREKDMYIYHTGLAFESDFNIGQFIFVRSSNRKTDAYLCNHVGVADSAIYRGEILVCFKNRTSLEDRIFIESSKVFFQGLIDYGVDNDGILLSMNNKNKTEFDMRMKDPLEFAPYKVGDRVAQMVFMNYPTVNLIEVDELSETVRGSNAFGSSGN